MNRGANKAIAETLMEMANLLESGKEHKSVRIGITLAGSELGAEELLRGIELANRLYPEIECIPIGRQIIDEKDGADCEKEIHDEMEKMLQTGSIHGAVTMHYNFPIGVATVGRISAPANGREMFLSTTTGTASSRRVEALVQNTIAGIAAAKACGIVKPTVGFLNIDGARQAEKIIRQMNDDGYEVKFASSVRIEGGIMMRGNDLLTGACDVMVTDSLTGNLIMKMLSSYHTGGTYEAIGYGYGPGIGIGVKHIVCILSRASGAPVVAGAIRYAADVHKGKLFEKFSQEHQHACRAGMENLLDDSRDQQADIKDSRQLKAPPEKIVTEEITGIDILDLDNALHALWSSGVFGKTGMGCTGPVIMIADDDKETAISILKQERFL